MVEFLNLVAAEPDIARVPVMVDSSKFSRHRGRPEMHPGQADRELDLHEGGRGRVHRAGADLPRLRRRRRRDGLRRAGPGRHARAQGRDLHPRLQDPHRGGRLPARGHHLRSERLRGRDRHRGAQRLRRRLHRGDAHHPRDAAARPYLRRRLEPVVLVPRQRAGARGHALRVPLPCHQGRHGHGHRQCRPARASTSRSIPSCASSARTWSSTAAPTPPSACSRPRRASRATARRPSRRPISNGAPGRSRSGSSTRSSTASPNSSRRTPRRRARRPSARST